MTASASTWRAYGLRDDASDDLAACRGLHLLAGREALGAADDHAIAGLQCALDRDEAGVAGADAHFDAFAAVVGCDAYDMAALVAGHQCIARHRDRARRLALGQ